MTSDAASHVLSALLEANEAWRAGDPVLPGPAAPARHVAVVTCMDARIPVLDAVGAALGDIHVIRSAGGIVTDDTIRSLVLSQRALGTTAIVVMPHTRCGVAGLDEAALADQIEADTGERPTMSFGSFDDVWASLAESIATLEACSMLPHRDAIIGVVYDVETGALLTAD